MNIIPAIDLRNKKCVRLTKGELKDEKIYSEDPLFIAKIFKAQGAKLVHIIDLDGAFTGIMSNREIIIRIRKEAGVMVQTGGGIRSVGAAASMLDNGIDRVILGTVAFYHPEIVEECAKKWPGRILVSIDARKEKLAIAGWKEKTQTDIYPIIERLKGYGITEIIYTDIDKDGTLEGPDIPALEKVLKKMNIKTIISGGISCIEDIKKLKAIEHLGISGVITGKAIYEDRIDLKKAILIGEANA